MTVGLHRRRHRALDSGRHWCRAKHRAARQSIISAARVARGIARSLPGDSSYAIFFVKPCSVSAAFAGFACTHLFRHHRLPRQAAGRGHRGHGRRRRPRPCGPPAQAGWQWINYGVQPQVMPRMIGACRSTASTSIFASRRWSASSAAGGIGATLNTGHRAATSSTSAAAIIDDHHSHRAWLCEYGSGYCAAVGATMAGVSAHSADLAASRAARPTAWSGRAWLVAAALAMPLASS